MTYSINDLTLRRAVLEDLNLLARLNGFSNEAVEGVCRLLTSPLEIDRQQRDLLDAYLDFKSAKLFEGR